MRRFGFGFTIVVGLVSTVWPIPALGLDINLRIDYVYYLSKPVFVSLGYMPTP